jgi:hypothetical protein
MLLESKPKSNRVVFIPLAIQGDPEGIRRSSIIRCLNFVSCELEPCYYSSVVPLDKDPLLGKKLHTMR